MCGMCPDYVDSCKECPPLYIKENGYPIYPAFYLTMTDDIVFCEHLTKKYGTEIINLAFHIQYVHDSEDPYDCENSCIENNWWDKEEVIKCIASSYTKD